MSSKIFTKTAWLFISFSLIATLSFAQISDKEAIEKLKEGNTRFVSQQMLHKHQDDSTLLSLVSGQKPFAVIVSCSDSRTTSNVIFDQGLGDLFIINTAGNVMGDYEEGSIEYAVEHLNTKLIVVIGHTGCGAVKAFLDNVGENHNHETETDHSLGHIQSIIDNMKNQKEMQVALKAGEEEIYDKAILANITHGVYQLRNSEPFLANLYKEGKINIIGALYHIESGKVEFLDI